MTIAVRKPRRRNHVVLFPNLENVFNEFMNTGLNDLATSNNLNYTLPTVNIQENEKEFVLELAVPGLTKKDIKIEIEKDYLIVSADIKEDAERNFRLREFKYGVFKRKFYLNELVNRDEIVAKFKNGILLIQIAKIDKGALVKTIKIN